MISILTLSLMVVLAVLLRPVAVRRAERRRSSTDLFGSQRSTQAAKEPPGVVTYALMKDKKLPSPAQRVWRRIVRPFAGLTGLFGGGNGKPAGPPMDMDARRSGKTSAELQDFLDARNREIARRKAEGATKPGPDDLLH